MRIADKSRASSASDKPDAGPKIWLHPPVFPSLSAAPAETAFQKTKRLPSLIFVEMGAFGCPIGCPALLI
ncbi:hypothetical protein AXI58_15670 [Bacillus nakamurai]|uniref:Uncharacterized protein n=1 Tax=Bacillus nakamurai TaxID=1793963 RepID=A0A150F7H6_9BACI|nr:hypothetical protein AXI58_15670 [Bacillus nakamurai]